MSSHGIAEYSTACSVAAADALAASAIEWVRHAYHEVTNTSTRVDRAWIVVPVASLTPRFYV